MPATLGTVDTSWLPAALDAAPIAMMVVNADGWILFANAHAERAFGYSRSELEAMGVKALLTVDGHTPWRIALASIFSAPGAPSPLPPSELVGVNKSGTTFPIELALGHMGAPYAALATVVIRDIGEQRREAARQEAASAEAREARERLEVLLQFAPAFIIGVSSSGTIDFINRILPQHTREDVIGSDWLLYFPPERKALMEAELKASLETESTRIFETVTPGPDGADIWFESHLAPMHVGGQISGAVLVSQDITERKRSNAELLAGRHMALLGTLAAGVAHEINTPVQFVGDSLKFLRDSCRDLLVLIEHLQELRRAAGEGAPLTEIIAAAARAEDDADLPYIRANMPPAFDRCVDGLNRVTTIVRSLKAFAHPSADHMVPVDLNRAVESTLTIATNEYKYVAVLETDLGELPPVVCHAGEISQAILNIVVNAAQAIGVVVGGTDRKGLITVRSRREGDDAVISISDTGGGIPEGIRARIFDPFFTTKEVGKGTGQGLAIAWSAIAERHGGHLTFETTVGEGTTFFIRVPLAGTDSPAYTAHDARAGS